MRSENYLCMSDVCVLYGFFLCPNAGVYKSGEARLTLRLYHMRALVHGTHAKITEETWTMDGFVSIAYYFGSVYI